jgi:hypothetical protein
MDLHEEAINSGAGCCAGQGLDEFTLAAGFGSPAARQLHTMGGVEDHRVAEAPKDREGPHIDDEIVVAERRSSFCQDDPPVSGLLHFFHRVAHFLRGKELALLHVHNFAGLRRGNEQVGLPAKKRGNLEHVHNLPCLGRLLFRMDVR